LLVFSGICSSGWTFGPVVQRVSRHTGAEKVALIEGEDSGTWIDLNGKGILKDRPTTAESRVSVGGSLIWKEIRRQEGRDGGTHVFFKQSYLPEGQRSAFGLPNSRNGFDIRGSYLGFHYDRSGHLFGIAGTRFKNIEEIVAPIIRTRRGALESAVRGASDQRSDIRSMTMLGKSERQWLLRKTGIELVSYGDGREFGFLWTTKVMTQSGKILDVEIDAANGKVLAVWDGNAHYSCEPSTDIEVEDGVTGISQSGIALGGLPATEAPDLGDPWSGFTREAHRIAGSQEPEIIVYLGADGNDDQCSSSPGIQKYRVFPLTSTDGGTTWYDDWVVSGKAVRGRSAADAMLHTVETMDVFASMGWNSFDGQGATANILIDAGRCWNNARFNNIESSSQPRGVVICPRSSPTDAEMSAGLDIVAHEWGHGIVHATSNLPYDEDAGGQFHEGFADIVGHFVEEAQNGSTNWEMGESIGDSIRSCVVDDNSMSFHRCDPETLTGQPGFTPPDGNGGGDSGITDVYVVGHKLTVAFYLVSEGGLNPGRADCARPLCMAAGEDVPSNICDLAATAVPALGIDHAFGFFFKLMTEYISPTTDWEDLANLATLVGRGDLVRTGSGSKVLIHPGPGLRYNCIPFSDFDGVAAAHAAFSAIGYPPAHELAGECE